MRVVALIPARAGSKRIPHKNTKLLHGHPLIAYTIAAAEESGVFSGVYVCSEDEWHTREVAGHYGASFIGRSHSSATDAAPDVVWVKEVLCSLAPLDRPDAFAILRPTSPFRTAETIRRAWREFSVADGTHDSLRAVQPATENVYKMWTWQGAGYPIKPLLNGATADGVPLHSAPSQVAPKVYLQNSSLEIAFTSTVESHGTIAGRKIIPFFTSVLEGVSIDRPSDWDFAESCAAALLPRVDVAPVSATPEALAVSDPGGTVARGTRV